MTLTRFAPGPDTSREFRDALGRFATGVTVVTCQSSLGPLGITANSFASVSLEPPLVLWSPARSSRRFDAFVEATEFAIHILGDDQTDLCNRFSNEGLDFGGLDWKANDANVPLIEGVLARFECTRHAVHEGGDHAIVVGRVTQAAFGDGNPMVFSKGRYGAFRDV